MSGRIAAAVIAGAIAGASAPAAALPFAQPRRERLTTPEDATWAVAAHGSAVAIRGDRILVGAPLTDIGASVNIGLATLYRQERGVWSAGASLPGQAPAQALAGAVALSAEWRAIGATGSDLVLLFKETDDDAWPLAQSAQPVGAATAFGAALALDDATLLVGAHGGNLDLGRVMTYRLEPVSETWAWESTFTAPVPAVADRFGQALLAAGDVTLVGAPGTAPGGAIYRLQRAAPESPWLLDPSPLLPALAELGEFGAAIALEGDLLAVGAPGSADEQGRVVVHQQLGAVWMPITVLEPPAEAAAQYKGIRFGDALAFTEGSLLVGAPGAGGGAVYIFNDPLVGGPPSVIVSDPSGDDVIGFGQRLAVDGRRVAVGAPGTGLAGSTGYAYVLDLVTALGVPCVDDLACASGSCVDGLCCDQPCDDACVACSVAAGGGFDGLCSPMLCPEGQWCVDDGCVDQGESTGSGGTTTGGGTSSGTTGDDSATGGIPGLVLDPIADSGCACRAGDPPASAIAGLVGLVGLVNLIGVRRRPRRPR